MPWPASHCMIATMPMPTRSPVQEIVGRLVGRLRYPWVFALLLALFLADLEVDSPYNTYLYAGLPPGPIANPTLSALQAVASPENTPFYFFRAACDGSGRHVFAETFEQVRKNFRSRLLEQLS